MDRRIGSGALARLLGSWAHGGAAYVALADGMRRSVLDGRLPLGTRLPSERELADALGVSRTTTAATYQRLRELGYVTTRRGSGSVTTMPTRPAATDAVLGPAASSAADVVDLTMAAPPAPRGLHEAAQRAVEALPAHLSGTGYLPAGLPALRAALADRYTRRGTPTTPQEILVTSGAQQAISLLMSTLLAPGDRIVIEHPTYPNAIGAARSAGARPVPVPIGPDGLDIDLLESTIRQTAPRLVHLTPDHHNPTGLSLDDAARERVRDLAARYRTVVVGDETLTDLTLEGTRPVSFSGPVTRPGVVAIGSASKTFWGGLRVGWIRGHRELISRLANERARADSGGAVLDQLVVLELLETEHEALAERLATVRTARDALLASVALHLPWQVATPSGGLSAWADLGAPVSSALAAVAHQHGVRVVPGPVFGVDGSFENRLRLTFTQSPQVLDLGVRRLAAAWASLGLGPGASSTPVPAETTVV